MAKAEKKEAKPKAEKKEKPEKKVVEKKAAKPKAEKKEKPAKKEKKEKDPNAPKRALGSYMFFSADKRGEIKEKNPSYGVADIAKELGAAWKALGEKEKSKYEELAKKDKERYEKEKAKYDAGK
ncbi:Non-histone chromosomal protein 6 [Monoraphidium neglectum]|uniref:Non-histone chromosomal protein 6 n=1 Tax=Monoraphidium neglectum TaxID=145388 RepID=A0A0D2MT42_9CHLO|nr:Non-histone chromosomal protein 6 [Monoraphidium neglectum]KIZ03607.1 Non-histone chromosomal protein 6 [Monoraphidium neglectum]|eukprot:XP_013902626.1 Non-histone chromosomal protein 6 [Monoraphidium neglectum]